MKFQNTRVTNFQGAFRGLRNPLESWIRSDSFFGIDEYYNDIDWEVAHYYCEADGLKYDEESYTEFDEKQELYANWLRDNGILYQNDNFMEFAYIGPKDLDLAKRMIKAGTSDSKFLRQINVSVDITAPLYWWKQFDTYKIGTVANSTSTMHKLSSTPITLSCFEIDDFNSLKDLEIYSTDAKSSNCTYTVADFIPELIHNLETLRLKYLETKDQRYWKELIRWLPNAWLQKRTVTMNYAVIRNQYFQRQHHKLTEWKDYCKWVESLPYSTDLITYTGKN